MRAGLGIACLLASALVAAGCEVNEYCINCAERQPGPDGGLDGGGDGAVGDAGGSGDACVATLEACNGLDDDCDGATDEGELPSVGNECGTDVGPCEAGTLECTGGELVCGGGAVLPSAEACNDVDDDCDGTVDDGDPGGGIVCGTDVGECQKGLTACLSGSIECVDEIGPQGELCDAMDNDCDGMFDEGNPEGGAACGDMQGDCLPGTMTCLGGALQCVGGSSPGFETCDESDNDCDGDVDEDFDLQSDPLHCGDCFTECDLYQAQAGCSIGECTISFCFTDYWDLNGDPGDGCEHFCEFAGSEICNGEDDDCDGGVDEDTTPPDICIDIGECAGTTAICAGQDGWDCPYGQAVSTDAGGDVIPEIDCDGLDNDCDGVPDDAFPQLGEPCTVGQGACETDGVLVCNGSEDGVECDAPAPPAGDDEVCDGIDNDCDGALDEGAPEDWVQLAADLWIYKYEASRPDAGASSQGVMEHRPCSLPDRLPWTNVTQPEAEAACAAVGASLCSEAEWLQACRSSSGTCEWSYASSCSSYQPETCNGNDYDFDAGASGDQDGLLATGALAACYADWGGADRAFDMSGNVKEWTLERSPGVNPLRGGSYNNTATGISCEFDFAVADDAFEFQNVGFRCCRDSAP